MAVLDETPILRDKRSTLESWPASRSLGRLRGPPPLKLRRTRSTLRFALRSKRRLERVTRLELATSSLARRCSTTELHPLLEGIEIMAQQAHSATVNSADWRSARL